MATPVSQNTLKKVRTYLEEGVPIAELTKNPVILKKVHIAEEVYERLQQDPMLDVQKCLRRTYGRTKCEARGDRMVINLFVEILDGAPRKTLIFRARRLAEDLVRIGQQTGDPKWIDKGLSQLIRLDRLDEEENPQEDVRNTAALPPVLVDISVVNASRTAITEEKFRQLVAKYGGRQDDFDRMVELRAKRLRGEGVEDTALCTLEQDSNPDSLETDTEDTGNLPFDDAEEELDESAARKPATSVAGGTPQQAEMNFL